MISSENEDVVGVSDVWSFAIKAIIATSWLRWWVTTSHRSLFHLRG
jgi:hypothetical protein